MLKTFNVLLDTVQATNNPSFSVNTNDLKTLQFNITIQQNEVPLDLSNATVKLAVKKPDNKTTFQDVTVVYGPSGTCQVTLDTQSYMVPGYHKAEAMIYNGTDIVAVTSYFSYTATKGILDDTTIESTTEFQAINQIVSDAENIKSAAQASADSAAASATTAQNTVNGKADQSYVDTELAKKAKQSDLDITNQNVAANTSSLAEKVSKVNGISPDGVGNVTLPIPQVDTTNLATKTDLNSTNANVTANTNAIQSLGSGSPKGVYTKLSDLQTAKPTGDTNIYVVKGNVFEVDALSVTAAPTASGNVTVTLNGVATNIAVTIGTSEVDTFTVSAGATSSGNITITLNGVATNVAVASGDTAGAIGDKIRATVFTGWTVGGTAGTATVTFTKNTVGTNTVPTYSAGTTGATGSFTVTTAGVNADTTTTVATKIRGVAFSGWTTGGSGTSVTFTKTTAGTNSIPTYSAGSTGATGTMSVTTAGVNVDGNWYYWNGSAWTAGGLYQGIDDTLNSSIRYGLQLFNSSMNVSGQWINSSGAYVTSGSSKYAKIPVTAGETVSITRNDNGAKTFVSANTGAIAFIDTNGNILSSVLPENYFNGTYNNSSIVTVTIPANTAYLGLTTVLGVSWDITNTLIVVYGSSITATLLSTGEIGKLYGLALKDLTARANYSSLTTTVNSLASENTLNSASKYGLQLFNSSMNVTGTWINPTGAFVTSSTSKYAKIPIIAGETVSITRNDNGAITFFSQNTGAIAFIDTNGNILSSVSPESYFNGTYNNSSIVTITIPANTAYLGLTTVLGASWDITSKMIVVYGDAITATLLATGEIGKLYGLPLKDLTARSLLKGLQPTTSYVGKKWAYVGDSITENNTVATSHYWTYIQNDLGFTGINMGSSGTGYKRTESENKAFYQRILSIDTTADIVTIFGSVNDAYYETYGTLGTPNDVFTDGADNSVCACINKAIDNLYSVMPLAKVGLITPLPSFSSYPSQTTSWYENYVDAIVQIGKQRGIPVLDLYHRSLLKPWDATQNSLFYEADITKNTHPNANGHKVFYPAIREFLKTLI